MGQWDSYIETSMIEPFEPQLDTLKQSLGWLRERVEKEFPEGLAALFDEEEPTTKEALNEIIDGIEHQLSKFESRLDEAATVKYWLEETPTWE